MIQSTPQEAFFFLGKDAYSDLGLLAHHDASNHQSVYSVRRHPAWVPTDRVLLRSRSLPYSLSCPELSYGLGVSATVGMYDVPPPQTIVASLSHLQCWCGAEGIDYARHGEATCNRPCTGDDSIDCGGTWAFSIYEFVETDTNYIGCFKDTYGDRVLPTFSRSNSNGPEVCFPSARRAERARVIPVVMQSRAPLPWVLVRTLRAGPPSGFCCFPASLQVGFRGGHGFVFRGARTEEILHELPLEA